MGRFNEFIKFLNEEHIKRKEYLIPVVLIIFTSFVTSFVAWGNTHFENKAKIESSGEHWVEQIKTHLTVINKQLIFVSDYLNGIPLNEQINLDASITIHPLMGFELFEPLNKEHLVSYIMGLRDSKTDKENRELSDAILIEIIAASNIKKRLSENYNYCHHQSTINVISYNQHFLNFRCLIREYNTLNLDKDRHFIETPINITINHLIEDLNDVSKSYLKDSIFNLISAATVKVDKSSHLLLSKYNKQEKHQEIIFKINESSEKCNLQLFYLKSLHSNLFAQLTDIKTDLTVSKARFESILKELER